MTQPEQQMLPGFAIGTRVRIMMGRRKRYGVVKGWQFVNSTAILQRRVMVEVDGVTKSYLPRSLKVVESAK